VLRYVPWLLVAACAFPSVAAANTSRSSAGSRSAHAATVFRVDACGTSLLLDKQYIKFKGSLKKFTADVITLGAKEPLAAAPLLTIPLSGPAACPPVGSGTGAVGPGKQASARFSQVIKLLDKAAVDYDAMKRAVDAGLFDHQPAVKISIEASLAAADGWVNRANTSLVTLKGGAAAYANADCPAGQNLTASGAQMFSEAWAGLIRTYVEINATLAKLAASCDAVDVLAPLTSAEINHDSGGGGAQLADSHRLSVLAPQRLSLQSRGRNELPVTLTTPTAGDLELDLASGKTQIASIVASTGRGAVGLELRLPAGTPTGASRLTVTFTPQSAVNPTVTVNVTILVS
jgi:hypothetical protein